MKTLILTLCVAGSIAAQSTDPKIIVAQLDSEFQAAVKVNDAATMDRILGDGYSLVLGNGRVVNRPELMATAVEKTTTYEKQDPSQRTVRVYGDKTAIVTALLWLKGTRSGKPIDYKLWYSDTYVLTPKGWKYMFGQASLPLPEGPGKT